MMPANNSSYIPIVGVSVVEEPWVMPCFTDPNCKHPGLDYLFMKHMLNILGYDFGKTIKVNSADELIVHIKESVADMIIGNIFLGGSVSDVVPNVSITNVVLDDTIIYIFKDIGMSERVTNMSSIYHWPIWITLAVLLITIVLQQKLFTKFSENANLMLSVTQSASHIIWWIFLAILLGVFSNVLAIFLSVPLEPARPFQDIDDLSWKLYRKQCRIVVLEVDFAPGYGVLQTVAPLPPFLVQLSPETKRRFIDAYTINPPLAVDSLDELIHAVKNNKCYIAADWFSGNRLLRAKDCSLKWIEDKYAPRQQFVTVLRKSLMSTLGDSLNLLISQGSSSEIYDRFLKRINNKHNQRCVREDELVKPLKFHQIQQAFVFLCVAMCLGILVCFLEMVFNPGPVGAGAGHIPEWTRRSGDDH